MLIMKPKIPLFFVLTTITIHDTVRRFHHEAMAYLLLLWLLRIHIWRTKSWSFQGSLFIREPHHCSLNKFLAGTSVSDKSSNKYSIIFHYREVSINTSDDGYCHFLCNIKKVPCIPYQCFFQFKFPFIS